MPAMDGPQLSVAPNPDVPFAVVHEDADVLVVCKPAGVVTQPGVGHEGDALLNGLFARWGKQLQNLGKKRDFGLLHRLDRPTSGLVVVGLTPAGYDGVRRQFEKHTIEKTYLALTHGTPQPASGTERTPLREARRGGQKVALAGEHPAAQKAVTRYETLIRARGVALVKCRIQTGRLHQIRVHLALLRAPVVGDRDYGPRDDLDRRFTRAVHNAIFLHAAELGFTHPVSGERLTVRAPLPAPLLAFLETVGVACPREWR
jgi:23S rRNA pseudouridine1911/1915/1917 synthase